MSRYELSISPSYVPDWGLTDAVREIFQNALDQQAVNPENTMDWDFSKEDNCFIISSKNSRLSKDTLLFGVSTKADDVKTIGMFGEGYKLALLVLTRLGYPVTIYNYSEKEVWKPKIINSRRYGTKLLVVDIEKIRFKSVPEFNLKFVIEGTHAGDISDIGMTNLHVNKPKDYEETDKGRILFEDRFAGKVFINGLYVCKKDSFRYGYDIKPQYLTIGRDRNLIGEFNLSWVTSQMWSKSQKPGLANDLLKNGFPDVGEISTFAGSRSPLAQTVYEDFKGSYGKIAYPVTTQEEYDLIKKSYKKIKPILVNKGVKYITVSYTDKLLKSAPKRRDDREPKKVLEDFLKKYNSKFYGDFENEFNRIIKKANQWTFK